MSPACSGKKFEGRLAEQQSPRELFHCCFAWTNPDNDTQIARHIGLAATMATMFEQPRNGTLFLGGQKISGSDIRDQNVLATQAIANVVKSSFGPSGLDKMMVDDIG
ncbi:hypothetical protein E4U40_005347, partial [Claviceps sp. LM458 group G5]